jgi:hypothetical protein
MFQLAFTIVLDVFIENFNLLGSDLFLSLQDLILLSQLFEHIFTQVQSEH